MPTPAAGRTRFHYWTCKPEDVTEVDANVLFASPVRVKVCAHLSAMSQSVLKLNAAYQTYEWGKLGPNSKVAALVSAAGGMEKIDANQHYAELWMGTHPKGPSVLSTNGQLLSSYLAEHPDSAGAKLEPIDGGKTLGLPFLFKVLSVDKALSIQVHPNKEEAIKLHAKDAKNYPDSTHKPEMAIALTPFELLCSFRPASEVLLNIKAAVELVKLVGENNQTLLRQALNKPKEEQEALKQCFSSLMKQPSNRVAEQLNTMLQRIGNTAKVGLVDVELLKRLNNNYPGDVGCWAPFFMNHFTLQPGEAVFLGPNEPHAYLSGVRAGLTPKFKDVENLCRMLTYKSNTPTGLKLKPVVNSEERLTIYDPPINEFCVHKIEVNNNTPYTLSPLPNCSIIIVLNGEAHTSAEPLLNLSVGFVGFIPARSRVSLIIEKTPLVIFRAFSKQQ